MRAFATATLLSIALISSGCGSADTRVLEEVTEEIYPLNRAGRLMVKNTDGVIRVYGADIAEVKVQTLKKAFTRKRLGGIKVAVSAQPDTIVIDTFYPPKPDKWSLRDRSGTVDYTIIVPETCKISRLELANGEVVVEGIRGGSVNARVLNGRMYSRNCFADSELSVDSGGLDIFYDWWESRAFSLTANVVNGNARAALPPDASFHVEATAVAGNISSDFGKERASDSSGVRKLSSTIGIETTARPLFKIHAVKGNIRIQKAY